MKGTDVMAKEGFSNFEIAMIEQIAHRVANVMIDRAKEIVETEMTKHREACPMKPIFEKLDEKTACIEVRLSNMKSFGSGWLTGVAAFASLATIGLKLLWDHFKSPHQ